jgi:outer membrane receptor protein involved in Fe transport
MKKLTERQNGNRRVYLAVISSVALSCGGTALAQTDTPMATNAVASGSPTNVMASASPTNAVVSGSPTNVVASASPTNAVASGSPTNAMASGSPTNAVASGSPTNAVASASPTNVVASGSSTNVTQLGNITVIGKLNQARSQILPDLGATAYTHTADQIQNQSQGANAPFNQVILRSPGVAQDSAANGDLHVRGEHANLQYRIDDVLLPEGISGFGLELDPRFVDSMQLVTGSLPAQYGFRTAGVVDIQTKGGAIENGGTAEMYGGSFDTIRPSFEYGGSQGKLSYFIDGSYEQNSLGIENVTSSSDAIHDDTEQYKTFVYLSYILDDTSRVSFIGSASYANFQIPINPDQPVPPQQGDGNPWVPPPSLGTPSPTDLNDNQNEQNYYGVVAYQKSAGDLNYQVAAFGRNSSAHYVPDNVPATLYYNAGVATDENRILYSGGLQADASYDLGDKHTVRGGLMTLDEFVTADTTTTVFTNSVTEIPITQDNTPSAAFAGVYLEDEWKVLPKVTVNYGARFDVYSSSTDDENQLSPRINLIYQPTDLTTLHAGYSRYFTPPPLETVPAGNITAFNGTTGQAGVTNGITPVKAERANYYDAGISQTLAPGLQVGVNGYYKTAKNQLDDGLFGQSLILSSFNYSKGKVYGVEFTGSYTKGGFSSYANVAWSQAYGQGAASAQFLWPDEATVNYVNSHWIYLDHDQLVTGSFGVAYTWNESARYSTRVYADAIYGSGLRQDGGTLPYDPNDPTAYPGDQIPNGASVPSYYTINVGVEQSFKVGKSQFLKARLDVVNLTDNSYELRSGTGVGVNAPQYGSRLGFFGSLSYMF